MQPHESLTLILPPDGAATVFAEGIDFGRQLGWWAWDLKTDRLVDLDTGGTLCEGDPTVIQGALNAADALTRMFTTGYTQCAGQVLAGIYAGAAVDPIAALCFAQFVFFGEEKYA